MHFLKKLFLLGLVAFAGEFAYSQVPQVLNYQGRIAVNGTNFTGTGQFKFALVNVGTNTSVQATGSGTVNFGFLVNIVVNNGGSGYSTPPAITITDGTGTGAAAYAQISGGTVTNIVVTSAGSGYSASPVITVAAPPQQHVTTSFWSNDGTSNAGGQPSTSVPLPVAKGLYSVLLGDTTLSNMTTLPAGVFANSSVWLRVWFNDGITGFQLLNPDQRLAAVGYAIMAGAVPDGSITASKIAAGAVGSSQLASNLTIPGTLTVSNLVINGSTVTGPANYVIPGGTNIQTLAGASYFITNSSANIILPQTANVGDVVRIQFANPIGTYPFNISQNPGQRVVTWQPLYLNSQIFSSADATRLALGAGGCLFLSTNSTASWTLQPPLQPWPTPVGFSAVAISSDGSHIYAGANFIFRAGVLVSSDFGQSWNLHTNGVFSDLNIQSLACSSNGVKAVAVGSNPFGAIYTTSDSGSNWVLQTGAPTNKLWDCVASSADGAKLVVLEAYGSLYTSANSGSNWTLQAGAPTNGTLVSVASSADGAKLVASGNIGIYTSTDSGSTWVPQTNGLALNDPIYQVASSADGTKLVAGSANGIYTSVDSGSTWVFQTNGLPSNFFALSVVSSSDGLNLFINTNDGGVYKSSNSGATWSPCSTLPAFPFSTMTALSTLGSSGGCRVNLISGGNNELDFFYLGNGLFSVNHPQLLLGY